MFSVDVADDRKAGDRAMFTYPQWHTVPEWMAVITPEAVQKALTAQVSEFSTGQLTLTHCESKRLRLRNKQGTWSGVYRLTIQEAAPDCSEDAVREEIVTVEGTLLPPGTEPPAEANSSAPFSDEQWRCYLPELRLTLRMQPADTKLAALPQLTEPEAARSLLEESIRTGGEVARPHLQIEACQPQVMRYKPGSRCTILYHLDYPDGAANGTTADSVNGQAGPEIVVAKTYRGAKGKNAYASMQALWRSPLGSSPTVTIAEPLAFLPELNVLVQGPIPQEATFEDLMRRCIMAPADVDFTATEDFAELVRTMRKTVAGLAELHHSGVAYGETVTWEDEVAEIYEQRERLAVPLPQFADWADDLLEHLKELAATHPADAAQPAHRSFRPAQVLTHQGEIGFIDFDGFCQAEPAMDLALFMTTIKNISLNRLMDEVEAKAEAEGLTPEVRLGRAKVICELFLTEYEKVAAVSRTRIQLWETVQLLSLVLGSWTKYKLARLGNCRLMLEQHLNGMMNEEMAT